MRRNSTARLLSVFMVMILGLLWAEDSYAPPGPDAISNNGIDDGVENQTQGAEGRYTTRGELQVELFSSCSSGNFRSPPGLSSGAFAYMDGARDLEWSFVLESTDSGTSPELKLGIVKGRNFYNRVSGTNPAPTFNFIEGFSTDLNDPNYATIEFFPNQGTFSSRVRLTFPNRPITTIGVNPVGEYVETNDRYRFVDSSLTQGGVSVGGARVLQDLSQNGSYIQSSFQAVGALPQNFQFGQYYADNCNAIKSPLMLFFDDGRPSFQGKVVFRMTTLPENTYWPEAGAPGYFLAIDRNKDGQINDGYELFGNIEESNGFETLREFDSNKDNLIDKQDERFSELLLWQDKNSNGKSEKSELFSIHDKKVSRISLNYDSNRILIYGGRARARQWAHFDFTDKNGRGKQGEVIDMWFETASGDQKVHFPTPWLAVGGLEGPSLMDVLRRPQLESRLSR